MYTLGYKQRRRGKINWGEDILQQIDMLFFFSPKTVSILFILARRQHPPFFSNIPNKIQADDVIPVIKVTDLVLLEHAAECCTHSGTLGLKWAKYQKLTLFALLEEKHLGNAFLSKEKSRKACGSF